MPSQASPVLAVARARALVVFLSGEDEEALQEERQLAARDCLVIGGLRGDLEHQLVLGLEPCNRLDIPTYLVVEVTRTVLTYLVVEVTRIVPYSCQTSGALRSEKVKVRSDTDCVDATMDRLVS